MITEERLKELIEQKATVYFAIQDAIEEVELIPQNEEFYLKIDNGCLMFITDNPYIYDDEALFYDLENLFETREEAEWQSEFSNITRTETLSLPSFKQVRTDKRLADNSSFNFTTHSHPKTLLIYDKNKGGVVFNEPLNKENYIEACRLAKKLFLEGRDG